MPKKFLLVKEKTVTILVVSERLGRFDLIVCDFCKGRFKEGETVYEIHKGRFSEIFCSFTTLMIDEGFESFNVCQIIRFHKNCFKEIAGEKYAI